jgi:hypothetical protein
LLNVDNKAIVPLTPKHHGQPKRLFAVLGRLLQLQ